MVTQKETTTPLLRKKKAKLDFSRTVTREKKKWRLHSFDWNKY
jgi:hypothetical protein